MSTCHVYLYYIVLYLFGCLIFVFRHAIYVRSKAEKARLHLEPVWLVTKMAASRIFMSLGKIQSS